MVTLRAQTTIHPLKLGLGMKGKLNFKARMDNMGGERWVKEVCLDIGYRSCWMRGCAAMARDIGIGRSWDFSREGVSQWRMTRNHGERGIYSAKELKPIINMRVEEYGCKKWVGGIESKSTLILYKNKECPGKEGFYDGSWLSTLLFKARAGALELNGRTYRYNEGHIRGCQLCDLEWGNQETVKHFMAECPAYEMEMDWARERYIQVLGVESFNEVVQGDDAGLGCFLVFDKGVPRDGPRVL